MIAVDLSKLEALDADPKSLQQINFTGNLEEQPTIFFVTEEAKETILDSSQGTVKLFWYKFLLQYEITQYNALNVKLSNSQLNKLKSEIKNDTEIIQ